MSYNPKCYHKRELIEGFSWKCLDCGLEEELESISYKFKEKTTKEVEGKR